MTTAVRLSSRKMKPSWQIAIAGLVLIVILRWLLPEQTLILSQVAILALFVLSLDLVTGYAGLPTLGHAALFGVGAYGAGLCAIYFTSDPLVGLFIGAITGSILAAISGSFLVRYQGLAFLMLTIATVQIMQSLANKMQWLTGGDDGLSGYIVGPIFGVFEFDMFGVTGYWYSTLTLLVSLLVLRVIMASPFGIACVGIRENRIRMNANGTRVYPYLLKLYVVSGFFAGLAGALSAQITQVVALDSLGFNLSAEGLVMLVLGGAGNLYGALIGTSLFVGVHHFVSAANPFHWLFVIGALLMVMVFLPKGFIQKGIKRALWPLAPIWRRAT